MWLRNISLYFLGLLVAREAHEVPLAHPFKLPDRRIKQLSLTLQEAAAPVNTSRRTIPDETTDATRDRLDTL